MWGQTTFHRDFDQKLDFNKWEIYVTVLKYNVKCNDGKKIRIKT